MTTVLNAWNHLIGESCEIEVPADRSASCALVGTISSRYFAELMRGARELVETPGGISMSTIGGWTISRP